MFYLDASAAVAAITQEGHSEAIWRWLREHADAPILCSGWTVTEVSSALSIKVRTGHLTLDDRAIALANWQRLRKASLSEIAVAPEHFETASRYCDRVDLGLRAGDALHLAIAESAATKLLTFDRTMAAAALELGVQVEPL